MTVDLDQLIDQVTVAAPFGKEAVSAPLYDLLSHMENEPSPQQARKLLEPLRSSRHFEELQRASDALVDLGSEDPYVHRQLSQALIEQGSFRLAEFTLTQSLDTLKPEGREKSEALGLLGRLYKQKFVSTPKGSARAAKFLNDAIDKYAEAYSLDPAWHGANLVALTARAKREKIPLRSAEEPDVYAARLLHDLEQQKGKDGWTPWDHASAAEAALASQDYDTATAHLSKYINFPASEHIQVDGFMLAGTVRQLREIWEITADDDGPEGQLLSSLIAASLTRPGRLDFKKGEFEAFESGIDNALEDDTLEAIFGDAAALTHKTVMGLVKMSESVCQIIDRDQYDLSNRGNGTGFIVRGRAIDESLGDGLFVLTNNHVLSNDGESPSVRVEDADALFHNWPGEDSKKRFRIGRIVDYSSRRELDLTLATLEEFPEAEAASISKFDTSKNALQVDQSRVHLIGHPGGHELSYSVSNNLVKDHDLDDDETSVNRIHYENPTEKGMSGSPVFNASNLRVIGIHRKGGSIKPIRDSKKPEEGPYRANEAVWAGSMHSAGFGR